LTDEEKEKYKYGNSPSQDKINEEIINILNSEIPNDSPARLIFEEKDGKTLIERHLYRYTRRNTTDYFIHKDLKNFLERELDFYIKNEFLKLEDLQVLEESGYFDKLRLYLIGVRAFRKIAQKIIEFLSQIENFQKKLWEKKKFVVETNYVITLDKIKEYAGDEFLEKITDEILGNEKQLNEWKELFGVEVKGKDDLLIKNELLEKKWKKLPLDTKYFSDDFKWNLICAISKDKNLDDILDGILIKSENFHALNLLLEKYKEKVQTIYIDPPFNKEQEADYLYKVGYKDSTWITMLENRIKLARDLLNERGSIFVRCDYNGNMYVRLLMNEIFGEENFRNEIQVKRMTKLAGTTGSLDVANDSLFLFSKSMSILIRSIQRDRICKYCKQPKKPEWVPLEAPGEGKNDLVIINGKKFYARKNSHWTFKQEVVDELFKKGLLRINESRSYVDKFGNRVHGLPEYLQYPFQEIDNDWTDIPGYSREWDFQTENSEILLKRVIQSTSNEGDLIMDFFLGSGTTTAVAHKLKRKWIGVEMGEHFWTVVLPRMKKVLFYDKSGISKENDVKEKYNEKTAGGFFKYHTLEQYEDALENIEFQQGSEEQQNLLMQLPDYFVKYMLEWETKSSSTFLNLEKLKDPFNYQLNIIENYQQKKINVDVIETFNYLIGLFVNRYKVVNDNGRKYIFVFGERNGKKCLVVWRNIENLDYNRDKEIIENNLNSFKPDEIYINGDAVISDFKPIEPLFKSLIFEG
jgi:adenine-specific DNA-methyltransferase